MKINPVNTYSKIVFGSLEQQNFIATKEACIDDKGLKPNTMFFRYDMDWNNFPEYIVNNFSTGTKIYNFACSDGSEIYSTKLMIDKKLQEQNLNKKFEYYAFDINQEVINKAQKYTIEIDNQDKGLYKVYIGDDFDKKFEQIKDDNYKVIDENLNDIKFEYGDITQWAKQKQEKPCIVMFRNAMLYFNKSYINSLIKDLNKNLPSGSLVVVGDCDISESYITSKLLEDGFKPEEEACDNFYSDRYVYIKS